MVHIQEYIINKVEARSSWNVIKGRSGTSEIWSYIKVVSCTENSSVGDKSLLHDERDGRRRDG